MLYRQHFLVFWRAWMNAGRDLAEKTQHKHFRPVRSVDKIYRTAAKPCDNQVDKSVCICRLFKQNHEYQTDSQRIRHIRQKINGLEQIPERFYGT